MTEADSRREPRRAPDHGVLQHAVGRGRGDRVAVKGRLPGLQAQREPMRSDSLGLQ